MSEATGTIAALLDDLRDLGIRLRADGDRLRLSAPSGVLTPSLRAEVAARKAEILAHLQQVAPATVAPATLQPTTLQPVDRHRPLPLSSAQQRLWFLEQSGTVGNAYNVPVYLRLGGDCNVTALQESLSVLAARHEILRTRLRQYDGCPAQLSYAPAPVVLPVENWHAADSPDLSAAVGERVQRELERTFDLSQEAPWRAVLLQLGAQDNLLLLTFHHSAIDGWSLQIFERELAACYRARVAGEAPQLAPLPLQYADYAVWQQQNVSADRLAPQLAYWRDRLADLPPLPLPSDYSRRTAPATSGRHHRFTVAPEVTVALERLSREGGATLYMTTLAAFQVLLQRYSRQDRIAVGTPIANRSHGQLDGILGCFVNPLVMDGDLTGNPTFRELLERTKSRALAAFDCQEVPFEHIVAALAPQRSPHVNPLFQVAFALQPPLAMLEACDLAPGLQATLLLGQSTTVRLDLEVHLWRTATGALQGHCFYAGDRFAPETIAGMMAAYSHLLGEVAAAADRPIDSYTLLAPADCHRLLAWGTGPAHPYPRDAGIARLFAARAASNPEAVALVAGDRHLSYGDLDRRANRLAHLLRLRGVVRGSLVGFCLQRSWEAIVTMLAILKAGGAYMPLDPHCPDKRLALMLADSNPLLLVTQSPWHDRLGLLSATDILCLDREVEAIAAQPATAPEVTVGGEDLAYVIYTSGSTGRPKGVCVPQQAVIRLAKDTDYIDCGPQATWLQLAPLTFDAATFEVWGSLLGGARLAIASESTDPMAIAAEIARQQVTVLWLTASLFNAIVDGAIAGLRSVRQLLTGGEALSAPHVRKALQALPELRLINGYGPTENTTFTCCCPLNGKPFDRRVPIGQPIANTQVYVLDAARRLVPPGMPGDLYAGGDGLALGYLNLPELTAACFVANPFGPGRLYKTGDRVRWRGDGQLEFLGRDDDLIKLRGFRIELGEVETHLRTHPAVSDAVVAVYRDRLVAYVVPAGGHPMPDRALLRYLRDRLPAYAVPGSITLLAALPLTPNGKCDRRALPPPAPIAELTPDREPRSPQERDIAALFAELLGLESVGRRDNFFDLGGHSLLVARLAGRLRSDLAVTVPLEKIFAGPTAAELAVWCASQAAHQLRAELPACLLPLDLKGTGAPLFLLPPGGGSSLCYRDLASALDRPVYGFQLPGLLEGESPLTTVEAAATHFLAALRALQPHGPYYLAGWSYGGLLALELACQLERAGEAVALLGIVDRPLVPQGSWQARLRLSLQAASQVVASLGGLVVSYGGLQQLARGTGISLPPSLAEIRTRSPRGQLQFWQNLATEAYRSLRVFTSSTIAGERYRPGPYGGGVALFCARDTRSSACQTEGWEEIAPGKVATHDLRGNHMSIVLVPEDARILGQEIERAIAAIETDNRAAALAPTGPVHDPYGCSVIES